MSANGSRPWSRETRALAEDAAELIEVEYEALPHVVDPEAALDAAMRRSSIPRTAPTCSIAASSCGGRSTRISPHRPHRLSYRARWHRSATVPIETFGVVARWDPATRLLDVWASIQMPKYPDQLARALRLPGNARARAFRCRCRRQLWRQARPEAQRAGGLSRAPARLRRCGSSRTGWRICAAATRTGPTASSTCRSPSTATASCGRCGCARSTMSAPMPAARRSSSASRSAPSSAPIASTASNTSRSASPPTRRRKRRCAASARRRPISRSRPAWTWSRAHLRLDRIELRRRNLIRARRIPLSHPERQQL